MKNRMARTAGPARHPMCFGLLLLSIGLFSAACASESTSGPNRMELAAARNAADPAVVDLWGGGYNTSATAVNQAGAVVGRKGLQVLMWDHGTVTEVATLCPSSGCEPDRTLPFSINARGQVVGTRFLQAFLWDNGTLTNLGASVTDGYGSFASSINDAGDVLGGIFLCAGEPPAFVRAWAPICAERAVLWRDGSPIDLGALGGEYSSPTGLNSAGEVAGIAELAHARFEIADV